MKSKSWTFKTLGLILNCYNAYREALKISHEEAVKKTLKTYDDFYEVIIEKKKFGG